MISAVDDSGRVSEAQAHPSMESPGHARPPSASDNDEDQDSRHLSQPETRGENEQTPAKLKCSILMDVRAVRE